MNIDDLRPGDVLQTLDDIGPDVPAGLWVLTELGAISTLNRLGENEDGDLCTLYRQARVTLSELEQFLPMNLNLNEDYPDDYSEEPEG